jgi:DNA-binding IclR family transcriptional regulator
MSIPEGAQAVERALGVLEYVAAMSGPVTVAEIAKGMQLHRNTAYRLAKTLAARGYLEAENGAFTVGPKLVVLGRAASPLDLLLRRSDQILQEVCDATQEVVNLGVRRLDEVFYLGRWEATAPRAGVYVRTGEQAPLYASALGKVLLSGMGQAARADYYARCPFVAYTARTITRAADLEEQVQGVLAHGYAEDVEELSEGVRCVAVPVAVDGRTVAAISISLPALRFREADREMYVAMLTKAAGDIANSMGAKGRPAAAITR